MRQRGFGVIEVMVAMTVGLLVTLVAAALLIAANASYLNTAANTRVDDSGRFALALIGMAVHQAGHDAAAGLHAPAEPIPTPTPSPTPTPPAPTAPLSSLPPPVQIRPSVSQIPQAPQAPPMPPAITGLDAASLKATSAGIEGALAASVNGSDVLSTRFSGSADGATINCAGFDETGDHGYSIFYVAIGGDGVAELRCKYKGEKNWASDAVVRGVDSFQVLYGVDTDTPRDGQANVYLNANVINAMDGEAEGDGAGADESYWRRVTSVRVALLLHSELGSRPAGDLLTRYELLDGHVIDEAALPVPLQRRVRRVFMATFVVRNR